MTLPESGEVQDVIPDEPSSGGLGTVPPNSAGSTKLNGTAPIQGSDGPSSARVDSEDVLLGSKDVLGIGNGNGAGSKQDAKTGAKEEEESDDEVVDELPEPEKEEMDTAHRDMYLDTVSLPRSCSIVCLRLAHPSHACRLHSSSYL